MAASAARVARSVAGKPYLLQALRVQLRCKEIWVVGANRYRNPDEDLPADFEVERVPYYAAQTAGRG
jgi:hypothetical protein